MGCSGGKFMFHVAVTLVLVFEISKPVRLFHVPCFRWQFICDKGNMKIWIGETKPDFLAHVRICPLKYKNKNDKIKLILKEIYITAN